MMHIDLRQFDVRDALDMAILIEEEATERYEAFVEIVGTVRDDDAGDVFVSMARNEVKHQDELRDRRRRLFGDAPCRVDRSMFLDVEAPQYTEPRPFMSTLQAMELALSAEVRAYTFFDEAAKAVTDNGVRNLFIELREEEVEHQGILRDWMAAHEGGDEAGRDPEEIEEPDGL